MQMGWDRLQILLPGIYVMGAIDCDLGRTSIPIQRKSGLEVVEGLHKRLEAHQKLCSVV